MTVSVGDNTTEDFTELASGAEVGKSETEVQFSVFSPSCVELKSSFSNFEII